MADKKPQTRRLSFTQELRNYIEKGSFSESFFESLYQLAHLRIKRKKLSPRYLGFAGSEWDPEGIRELSMRFFVEHLCSRNSSRLNYILDRAATHDVDHLMMKMFDQFLSECSRKLFPIWWNFRGRIMRMMPRLVEERKATEVSENPPMWSPVSSSGGHALTLEDLMSQVKGAPPSERKKYNGQHRASPEVSEEGLKEILCSVFEHIDGPVDVNALAGFVCYHLGVQDAGFDSLELLEPETLQMKSPFLSSLGLAMPQMEEAETWVHVRQVFDRLTPRQQRIFRLVLLEGCSVPEACAALGLKKSVLYEELQAIRGQFNG